MRAARNEHPYSASGAEPVGDRIERDPDRCGGLGTEASETVADIAGSAHRVHLADPDENVEVRVVAGVIHLDDRIPVDRQFRLQWCTGEREHIGTTGQLAVVAVATLPGQQPPADRRSGIGRVVTEGRRSRAHGGGGAELATGLKMQRILGAADGPVRQVRPGVPAGDVGPYRCDAPQWGFLEWGFPG